MKSQKITFILILIALFLGSLVYSLETKNTPEKETTNTQNTNKKKIFNNFKESEIMGLKIEVNNTLLILEKTSDPIKPWIMKKPAEKPASDAVISYLLNLVMGECDRTFTITPEQLELYGLKQPFATITITLNDKKNHQLKLGKTSFNDEFIYGTMDNLTVLLLPIQFKYAVDRQSQEWEQE